MMLSPEMQERVEVSAQRGVIELDSQGSTSKFDEAFIENLPITTPSLMGFMDMGFNAGC